MICELGGTWPWVPFWPLTCAGPITLASLLLCKHPGLTYAGPINGVFFSLANSLAFLKTLLKGYLLRKSPLTTLLHLQTKTPPAPNLWAFLISPYIAQHSFFFPQRTCQSNILPDWLIILILDCPSPPIKWKLMRTGRFFPLMDPNAWCMVVT